MANDMENPQTQTQPESFSPVADNTTATGTSNVSGSLNTPPNPPQSNDDSGGGGSLFAIGLAIIALLGTGYNYWLMRNQEEHEINNIAIVDTDLIVSAYFAKNQNINNVEVVNDLQKINSVIAEQSNNGVLVVKASSVLGLPKSYDITNTIASQLGLTESDLSRAVSLKQEQQTQREQQQSQINQPSINTQTNDLNNLGLGSGLD